MNTKTVLRTTARALILLTLTAAVGCNHSDGQGGESNASGAHCDNTVKWVGEMKSVLSGDLSRRIELNSLASLPHLYAVGPLEGLKGEISVYDSIPSIATIVEGRVSIDRRWDCSTPFLVYVQVEKWKETKIPAKVRTFADVEAFVAEAANDDNIDLTNPFPFLIKGKPALVKIHVVTNDGYPQHSAVTHVPFSIEEQQVEMIGFYSNKHQGVFTHHGSNTHVHARTADGKMSGHVDDLILDGNATLFLPKL